MNIKKGISNPILKEVFLILLFCILPICYYLTYMLRGEVIVNFDGINGYNIINYYNQELWSGEYPLWNKYIECGVTMGAFHTIALYPLALLLSFLPVVPFSYAYYIVHLVIGAYFFYHFLKEIKCSEPVSFCVALIYEMSVHIGGMRKEHFGIIVSITLFPAIMYYIQKYLNTGKHHWLIVSAVIMGFQFFGGHTQVTLYSDVVVFLYLAFFVIYNKAPLKKSILHIISWFLTYFGVILCQLGISAMSISEISEVSGGKGSIDYMKSYSIHPVKFIMMLFPRIFGVNEFIMPLGQVYSSENDIEIYLGVLMLILLLFGIYKCFSNVLVKLSAVFMAGAVIYSAMAHIPFVAKIVYHIPIFNNFRVPSRALFIFIFFAFVIVALVLNECSEKAMFDSMADALDKVSKLLFLFSFMALVFFIGYGTMACNVMNAMRTYKAIFIAPVVISVTIMVLHYLYEKLKEKKDISTKKVSSVFCMIVAVITIIDTSGFTANSAVNMDGYLTRADTEIERQLADGNYKTFDAFNQIGVQAGSFVSYNYSVKNKIQAINGYMTYNNARIYQLITGTEAMSSNSTDLFYAFPNAENHVYARNSALSVLGIRYILDSSNIMANNCIFVSNDDSAEKLFSKENIKMPAGVNAVFSKELKAEKNAFYKIHIELDESCDPDEVYVDFYNQSFEGGNETVYTKGCTVRSKTIYYYVNESVNAKDEISFRIVSTSDKDFIVKNCSVYKMSNNVEEILAEKTPVLSIKQYKFGVNNSENIGAWFNDIKIKPNKQYYVTFDANTDTVPSFFYVDLYNKDYDTDYQQHQFQLRTGKNSYSCMLNTYDKVPEKCSFRFVTSCSTPIRLTNIKVYEIDEEDNLKTYSTFYNNGKLRILENPNAKDILFVNNSVKSLDPSEKVFTDLASYDLLNVSYAEGYSEKEKLCAEAVISDVNFGTNSITAKVSSEGDTFLNFSQCYNSHWNAYVDGAKTKVYLVDNALMGIDVPAGEHNIELRVEMPEYFILLGISISVIVGWIIYFTVCRFVRKKRSENTEKTPAAENAAQ